LFNRSGYLREEEARLILRQIVAGIAAIKEKEVMHRDLKLSNILMHFKALPKDIGVPSGKGLKKYIAELKFEKDHKTVQSKLADLGFARTL